MNSPIDDRQSKSPNKGVKYKHNNIEVDDEVYEADEPEGARMLDKNGARRKKHWYTKLVDKRWKKIVISFISVILAILLIVCAVFGVMWYQGKSKMLNGNVSINAPDGFDVEIDDNSKTVVYNGAKYAYNDNMTSILFIGIDREKINDTSVNGANSQADALFLAAIDTKNGAAKIIPISRDTIAEVGTYSSSGKYLSVEKMQICLAYAYGDGKETSCKNTALSVSRLLYGIPVDTYFCIDWSAVSVLTSTIGGVTVPEYDSNWKPTGKTTTLTSKNAMDYLRLRDTKSLNSNDNRVERQTNFVKAFGAKAIQMTKQDLSVPLNLYKTLSKYSITNLDASKVTYLSSVFIDGGASVTYDSIAGETKQGEKFAEFYPDEKQMYQLVLDTFYTKVSSKK